MRISPLEIPLRDLPPEGREFAYSKETGELDGILADLIGANPYEVQIHITPVGNAFDLRGFVKTSLNLQCSICGADFKFPVEQNVHGYIVIEKAMAKGDQQSRANHAHEWVENGPDYILLEAGAFNVAEYVHEIVALAEPMRPVGTPNCSDSCESLQNQIKRDWLSFGPGENDSDIRDNPFKVLEKIKLKS